MKKGKKDLYNDDREQEEILGEEYFLDEDIESDDDYWLDDDEEMEEADLEQEKQTNESATEENSEENDDHWKDEEDSAEYEEGEYEEAEFDGPESGELESEEIGYEESEYEESESEEPDEETEFEEVESSREDLAEKNTNDESTKTKEKNMKKKKRTKSKEAKNDIKKKNAKKNSTKTNKEKKNKGKILKIFGITAGVIAVAYIGVSVFFISHFYYNTSINGTDFSLKSAKSVENYMKSQVSGYVLTIIEKDNVKETINGADISLVYEESDEIKKALDSQNAFLWPKAFFDKSSTDVTVQVSYDNGKLNKCIEQLQALKIEQTEPVNAYPKFDGEQFVIEPEVTGTAVNVETLKEKVNQYITGFKSELNMMEDNCYKLPQYTVESEELQKACEEMNKYLIASITYKMNENVVVDKSVINEWVTVDENMQVTFNEEKVKEWLTWFGDTYDTVGTTRSITSPWGKTVDVSGGDYGWSIDEDAEYTALVESIKAGEVTEKEPAYYQTAAVHGAQDWGSTYVEVDLSGQHMWMIQNGAVAMECDVVTGSPTPSRQTPTGVYAMKEKMYGKTLVGAINPSTGEPEYRTPVSYWMRVTWTGIGFHDATWQSSFGGSRYQNGHGSHGCINMPYSSAASLIELVYTGIPVIIHN